MDTQEAIFARRAVKHYDANFIMPADDKARLMELARQTPTSFNIQNWRIVSLEDAALRKQVRAAAWNQEQVETASLAFVIAADLKAWAREPARYWASAPKPVQDFLVPAITQFYDGRDWQQRDEAMRSAGLVAQTLMLAAKSMGYDSCPMIGFDADAVGRLIHLPQDHVVCMLLVIGKASEPAWPKGGFVPDSEVFFTDRFPG